MRARASAPPSPGILAGAPTEDALLAVGLETPDGLVSVVVAEDGETGACDLVGCHGSYATPEDPLVFGYQVLAGRRYTLVIDACIGGSAFSLTLGCD